MAKGPTYVVKYRRRRKGLTNYNKRLKLLKSNKPRLVIRVSNNSTNCQIINYLQKGDKTIISFNSKNLRKYDYKGHSGNLSASYLAGFACGLKALKEGINEAVLDTGIHRLTKGCRIYAALKGAVDAGLKIPHNEKVFPKERRIQGYHIENYAKILKSENPEKYEMVFTKVLKNKLKPEEFVEHFQEVKKRIKGEF